MPTETREREMPVEGRDKQVIIKDASGFVIERSTEGPTAADELWDEATEGLIATD